MRTFNKLLPFFAAVLLAISAGACKEDSLAYDEPVYDSDQMRYVSVAIYSDASISRARAPQSRAEGDAADQGAQDPTFEYGEADESEINDLWFVAYDADGAVVGKPVNAHFSGLQFPAPSPDASVGLIAKAVVPITVTKGSNPIIQIICYANPIQIQALDRPISVVETEMRALYSKPITTSDGATKDVFAMANSVFYPTKEDGQLPRIAVPLLDAASGYKAIYNTEKEALDAIAADDINGVAQIFIERAASKVRVYRADNFKITDYVSSSTADGATDPIPSFTMTFKPSKWDVNCRGKVGFVLKCFRSQDALGNIVGNNLTYKEVSTVLGNNVLANWIWNQDIDDTDPDYGHRSFWGCSPAYYSVEYPEVVSDIMDMDTEDPTTAVMDGKYKLKYLKYSEVETDGNDFPVANGVASANYNYYLETTVGSVGFTSKNPNASIPSVIVTGTYSLKVNNGGTETALPANTTFYAYSQVGVENPYILFDNKAGSIEVADNMPEGCRSLLDYLGHHKQQTVFFFKGKDGKPLTTEQIGLYFEVKRPAKEVLTLLADKDGDYKLAARKFTIQLTEAAKTAAADGDGFKLGFVKAGSGYVAVSATNFNEANALLAKDAGFADIYSDGKAYFNIPIHHYGWQRATNVNKESKNGIAWGKVQTGDFGMVRNHIYTIGISEIKGLGTGVNFDYPIIPPSDESKQYIAYKLRVLNWAVVPVQYTEL